MFDILGRIFYAFSSLSTVSNVGGTTITRARVFDVFQRMYPPSRVTLVKKWNWRTHQILLKMYFPSTCCVNKEKEMKEQKKRAVEQGKVHVST